MELDGQILLWIQAHLRFKLLTPVMIVITHLGDAGWFWIALTAILLIFKKTRKAGIYSAISLIIMLLFNNLFLKVVVNRTRPYEVIEGLKLLVGKASDASFPSGHTCASFACVTAIYKNIPRKYSRIFLVIAVLIAYSRLYVGIHYPTDVIGGLIIGVVIGLMVNLIGEWIIKNKINKAEEN